MRRYILSVNVYLYIIAMTVVGGCIQVKDREIWEDNTLSARFFVWRNLISQTLWDLTTISLSGIAKVMKFKWKICLLTSYNFLYLNGNCMSRRFKYRQSSINAVSTNAADSFNIAHWDYNWRLFMRNIRLVTRQRVSTLGLHLPHSLMFASIPLTLIENGRRLYTTTVIRRL